MDNFKSNFLSRGQLGSKSNDKFFLSVLKMCKYFFGNLIFAVTARTLSGNRLKQLFIDRSWIDINTGVFLKEMCSVRCKNHGCRQKIPERTSSAMFDVQTIVKCCEFKRCTSIRLDSMLRELRKLLCLLR